MIVEARAEVLINGSAAGVTFHFLADDDASAKAAIPRWFEAYKAVDKQPDHVLAGVQLLDFVPGRIADNGQLCSPLTREIYRWHASDEVPYGEEKKHEQSAQPVQEVPA